MSCHRSDGEIHRVSDVAIEAADDEPLRRRSRRGRTNSLDDEACESLEKYGYARSERDPADGPEPRRRAGRLPTSQEPRDEASNHARREYEKQQAPSRSSKAPHSRIVRASTCPGPEQALRDSRSGEQTLITFMLRRASSFHRSDRSVPPLFSVRPGHRATAFEDQLI